MAINFKQYSSKQKWFRTQKIKAFTVLERLEFTFAFNTPFIIHFSTVLFNKNVTGLQYNLSKTNETELYEIF
jgi:hypothetical protein